MNLTVSQTNRVAEIFKDIAQVSLASVVIPYIIEQSDLKTLLIGMLTTLLSWFFSVKLTRS